MTGCVFGEVKNMNKIKIRMKAEDALIKVDSLNDADKDKIKRFNPDLTYISYEPRNKISRVLEMIDQGHKLFMGDEIRARFKEEEGDVFEYLSQLNDHDLWVEINRNKSNLSKDESATEYQLGLRRFAFHHAGTFEDDRDYIGYSNQVIYIFHYHSLDRLVNDIKKAVHDG